MQIFDLSDKVILASLACDKDNVKKSNALIIKFAHIKWITYGPYNMGNTILAILRRVTFLFRIWLSWKCALYKTKLLFIPDFHMY